MTKFIFKCTEAIFEFTKDRNTGKLIESLETIEKLAQLENGRDDEKKLHFKFVEDEKPMSIGYIHQELKDVNVGQPMMVDAFYGVINGKQELELKLM